MSESWIVGINPVEGALANDPDRVREVLVEQNSKNARVLEIAALARKLGLILKPVSKEQLEKLGGEARHQGVIALYDTPPLRDESHLPALLEAAGGNAFVLVLDGVTDPHNLGACLRSAEAAGVTAVIVPKDRAVGITPTVRRASAGAADRVPFVAATNLARSLKALKEAGVWLVGLVGDTDTSLYSIDFKGPIAIVVGSEGEGMRRLTREACDF